MNKISSLTLTLAITASIAAHAQFTGQRVNLGANINSPEHTDSGPVFTYDGKTMYFKRSVKGAAYDYDIYYSTLDNNNQWTPAQPLTELNNEKITEVEYVYPDGRKMIISGTFNDRTGVFYAYLKNGKWTDLEYIDLGRELNANEDNLNITLNTKQDVMVISVHGDLYYAKMNEGKWGVLEEIKNLNTSGYEYTPFLDYDDKTLYIAGTGYPGSNGEADIWKSTRLDDSWTNWSAPEKVSGNVNTDGWDSFFYIPPSKDFVYVYNLNEGDGDILKLKNETQHPLVTEPEPVVTNVAPEDLVLIQEAAQTDVVQESEGENPDELTRTTGGNLQELEEILLFPNPTRGQFTLALNSSNESTFSQVTILDQNLRTITTIGTAQSTYNFDLSEYANGVYFVRVQTNGKTTVKKVILDK